MRIAHSIAERLRTALHQPFQVADHELYVTASMGIAMYPRDGADVSTLRRNADAAMYEAKRSGKDRVLFFTPAMHDTFLEHLELETELRRALDRDDELSPGLPADLRGPRRPANRLRGAAALDASSAGKYCTGQVCAGSRRERIDLPAGRLGAQKGVPEVPVVAGPWVGWRPGGGERVSVGIRAGRVCR